MLIFSAPRTVCAGIALILTVALAGNVWAQAPSPTPQLPRGIIMTTYLTGIAASPGKTITFPVSIINSTSSPELIQLRVVSAPPDWEPVFQDRGYSVSEIGLLPGKEYTVSFQVSPPASAPVSKSEIQLQAVAASGVRGDLVLNVEITKTPAGGIKLTTDYPILKGSSGSKFEFKATVANNTGKDATFNLATSAPDGWEVSFQPAYQQKQISSIAVKAAQTQDVNVQVSSPQTADPGDYPILVNVSDDGGTSAAAPLLVSLIGTLRIDITTPSETLNTSATAGETKKLSVIVRNIGSAPVQNIALSSGSLPSGWTVTFKPDKLDALDPRTQRQVEAELTPSGKALAGDYAISLVATAPGATASKPFRVTVETPTLWGWVGVGIVVVVLGGLGLVFQRYSRR